MKNPNIASHFITLSRRSDEIQRQLELFPLPNKSQKPQISSLPGASLKQRNRHQVVFGEQKPEASPYLQIQSVRVRERVNPQEPAYALVILPYGVRVAGGQYSAEEAHAIANAVKGWDWSLDENQRPFCLPALEALLDQICKRSAKEGGER